ANSLRAIWFWRAPGPRRYSSTSPLADDRVVVVVAGAALLCDVVHRFAQRECSDRDQRLRIPLDFLLSASPRISLEIRSKAPFLKRLHSWCSPHPGTFIKNGLHHIRVADSEAAADRPGNA